jgi:hypothetical protein
MICLTIWWKCLKGRVDGAVIKIDVFDILVMAVYPRSNWVKYSHGSHVLQTWLSLLNKYYKILQSWVFKPPSIPTTLPWKFHVVANPFKIPFRKFIIFLVLIFCTKSSHKYIDIILKQMGQNIGRLPSPDPHLPQHFFDFLVDFTYFYTIAKRIWQPSPTPTVLLFFTQKL